MYQLEYFVAEEFLTSLFWSIYCMGDTTKTLNPLIALAYAEAMRQILTPKLKDDE